MNLKVIPEPGGRFEHYICTVDNSLRFQGQSPDEALGYAIREMWLAGALDKPVTIDLVMETDFFDKGEKS